MATRKTWSAKLRNYGWTGGMRQGVDSFVLRVELDREPGRIVQILIPRDKATEMARWIKERDGIDRAQFARHQES